MIRLLPLAVVLALSSTAAAQAPGATDPVAPTPGAAPAGPRKDPNTAMLLSVGTTLGGFVVLAASDGEESAVLLGLAGMYFGPSTGQWYAGRIGGIGLASRALGAVMFVKGITMIDQQGYDCLGYTDAECAQAEREWDREERNGQLYLYGGLGLWVGSTIYDFVMARRAAQAWNREHAVTLTPTLMSSPGGRATGLTLQMKF